MTDLLNEHERQQAAALGWVVAWVFCLTRQKMLVQVLPAPNSTIKSADALQRVVTLRAQAGDSFAQRVMSLVLNPPPVKKKTK